LIPKFASRLPQGCANFGIGTLVGGRDDRNFRGKHTPGTATLP
jgi:hypothetical protein